MRETGIKTFPAIPEHWALKPLKALVRSGTTITYGIVQAGPDVPDGIPYIRTSDMSGDVLREAGYLRTSPEIAAAYARSTVRAGDLVIAIRATVGKTLPVPPKLDGANLTQGTARIAPGPEVAASYLLQGFDAVSKGATFKEITLDMLRKFRVPVPPLPEQAAIAAHLDTRLARLDTLRARGAEMIERLREHRAALITAAVTGGVRVAERVAAEAA